MSSFLLLISLLISTLINVISASSKSSIQVFPSASWDQDSDGIIGLAGKDYPNYWKIPQTT